MKTLLCLTLLFSTSSMLLMAQELEYNIQENNIEASPVFNEESDQVFYLDEPDSIEKLDASNIKPDTINVRIGKNNVQVITNDKRTQIDVNEIEDYDSRWNKHNWSNDKPKASKSNNKSKRKFDGHWGGFNFGTNLLTNILWYNEIAPYSNYPAETPNFMDIRPEKSFEFNFNFAEYSFGFCPYIGIVTGLGLNFNDYKFKNRFTINAIDGAIQPVELPEGDFRLSKLSTGYFTAPLLLEIQIPGNGGHDHLFISGGVIGGLKMGEHTKTIIGDNKTKDKGDHYISPLRWAYTARVGFENMGIYATYHVTELFEKGKGPAFHPLTFGIMFAI